MDNLRAKRRYRPNISKRALCALLGPALFLFAALVPASATSRPAVLTFGMVAWISVWIISRPVPWGISGLIPLVVNAIYPISDMSSVLSGYASEQVFLIAGSSIIIMAWEKAGITKRISVCILRNVGFSGKALVAVWFLIATVMSSIMPNMVVTMLLCSMAHSLVGQLDASEKTKSAANTAIMLGIVWGANSGGMASPLGGAMNLYSVAALEEALGHEIMYTRWLYLMFPMLAVVTLITLLLLMRLMKGIPSDLIGAVNEHRDYCREKKSQKPAVSKVEVCVFLLLALPVILTFSRELWKDLLPALKPAYIFVIFSLFTFACRDKDGQQLLKWEEAIGGMDWNLLLLLGGGTAMGSMVVDSGGASFIANLIGNAGVNSLLFTFLIVTVSIVLSNVMGSTATAVVLLPVITTVCSAQSLPAVPYILIATVAFNIAFALPTSIRTVPLRYGLSPKELVKYGSVLTILTIPVITLLGWLLMRYWPSFSIM